uniref:Thioredoxin_16 domain-containing protein n=1 Tax=Mesocestoides corti TaxID=53468 RepID=A0A5K3EVE4_MESCO
MYRLNPVVNESYSDISHTDSMYRCTLPSQPSSTEGTASEPAGACSLNSLDKFIVNESGARSKLGQAIQARKKEQNKPSSAADNISCNTTFKTPQSKPGNEMLLDRYIIRKTAPVSKLGKHLQSQKEGPKESPEDLRLKHRLEELEQRLDAFLVPMGLVESSPHVAPFVFSEGDGTNTSTGPSQNPARSAEHSVLVSSTGRSQPNHCAVSSPIDLAIHCDPKSPPFAILLYSKLLQLAGRSISLRFYRHSSLESVPKHLSEIENFFVGPERSLSSEVILSVIWRTCPFNCMAISNPFTDLPLYGESTVLMSLARNTCNFSKSLDLLSKIDQDISSGNESLQNLESRNTSPRIQHSISTACCHHQLHVCRFSEVHLGPVHSSQCRHVASSDKTKLAPPYNL